MITFKRMRLLDRAGNIGMKGPITKVEITHKGVGEDMKKIEDTERALHPTLDLSPFQILIQYLGSIRW